MSLAAIKQISKEIDNLEEEQDLNQKMKKYEEIKKSIKECYSLLKSLNKKISTKKEKEKEKDKNKEKEKDNVSGIDEDVYVSYMNEISDEKVEENMECDDLEKQIEFYLDIVKKIDSCKKHLTSKKMKIITQK